MGNDQPWEEIEHTADVALRVHGEDLRALFENAARGMMHLIGGRPLPGEITFHETISLQAPDWEILLVDWLTELLYLIEERELFFSQIVIHRVSDLTLEAEISGGPAAKASKHVKAVTYHNLSIRHTDDGYETTVVFDV